jgi:hypothetical protein
MGSGAAGRAEEAALAGLTKLATASIKVLDRHHVALPVIGTLRVKEPTDKLRLEYQVPLVTKMAFRGNGLSLGFAQPRRASSWQ